MPHSPFSFDWPLVGNGKITEFLGKCVASGQVGHAYLFAGPENLGKTTFAGRFAQALLCDERRLGRGVLPCGRCPSCRRMAGADEAAHGDFHIIKKPKDKKSIGIEAVRELIRTLSMSSFLGGAKVGIVKHADTLTEEAANALLKTLEEPRPQVTIILIAADPAQLPATIVSRCQTLIFQPVPTAAIYDYLVRERGASRDRARDCARQAAGRPALAVRFLEDAEFAARYDAQVRACLQLPSADINTRFAAVAALLAGSSGPEGAVAARRSLEVWAAVIRDLLLLEFGAGELVQHAAYRRELDAAKRFLPLPALLRTAAAIRSADAALAANVAPLPVLESVAVSI